MSARVYSGSQQMPINIFCLLIHPTGGAFPTHMLVQCLDGALSVGSTSFAFRAVCPRPFPYRLNANHMTRQGCCSCCCCCCQRESKLSVAQFIFRYICKYKWSVVLISQRVFVFVNPGVIWPLVLSNQIGKTMVKKAKLLLAFLS